jgi:hypothetical protein
MSYIRLTCFRLQTANIITTWRLLSTAGSNNFMRVIVSKGSCKSAILPSEILLTATALCMHTAVVMSYKQQNGTTFHLAGRQSTFAIRQLLSGNCVGCVHSSLRRLTASGLNVTSVNGTENGISVFLKSVQGPVCESCHSIVISRHFLINVFCGQRVSYYVL